MNPTPTKQKPELLVSPYSETPSTLFTAAGRNNNTVFTNLWLSEVRTGLPKPIVTVDTDVCWYLQTNLKLPVQWKTRNSYSESHRPGEYKVSLPEQSYLNQLHSCLQMLWHFSSATNRTIAPESGLATTSNVFNLTKSDRIIWKEAYNLSQKEDLATDNRWSWCDTVADY